MLTASAGFPLEQSIRNRRHAGISARVNEGFTRDGDWRHSV
ncbi:hypothetical protein EKH55_5007 [Sinorhizobium alkalisoli]|nr:hypothetical protein EKH55_5007 [Sinorhizobium alkalisoli]